MSVINMLACAMTQSYGLTDKLLPVILISLGFCLTIGTGISLLILFPSA